MINTKKCLRCKEEKATSEFYKNKCHKDGLQSQCKECIKESQKEYRQTEGYKEYHKKYQQSEKYKAYQKEYRKYIKRKRLKMTGIDKPTNKELLDFFMEYISAHTYFKISTLVNIFMKPRKKIVNAKIRTSTRRSLAHRFNVLNRRLLNLDVAILYNRKSYKIIGDPYVLSKLTLKKRFV